jgi:hypothetical protein
MRTIPIIVLASAGLALAGLARVAHAYPQYQLSRDQTCTSCHLSPAGGGLLTENGIAVAESTAAHTGSGAFFYGAFDPPSWLQLGGDVIAAAGAIDNGKLGAAAFPMQAEVYASAGGHGFTLEVTGGLRRPLDGGSPLHVAWSREHYLMWRQDPSSPFGLYVRAGRFMPVFGLRLSEHVVYTQRYGGMPLYGEAYGTALEYIASSFEVHATGFVHDPIGSAVEHGDGGALYAEARIGPHAAIGVEGKYSGSSEVHTTYGGLTGKLFLEGPDLLFQAEAEVIHQKVMAGGSANQLAGYVMASHAITDGWLLDVGVGHFTQDTSVAGLYRDCLDVGVHWFTTPHVELLLTARLELLDKGSGPNGGYALAQLHYRL